MFHFVRKDSRKKKDLLIVVIDSSCLTWANAFIHSNSLRNFDHAVYYSFRNGNNANNAVREQCPLGLTKRAFCTGKWIAKETKKKCENVVVEHL
jgi:hypothetical protein